MWHCSCKLPPSTGRAGVAVLVFFLHHSAFFHFLAFGFLFFILLGEQFSRITTSPPITMCFLIFAGRKENPIKYERLAFRSIHHHHYHRRPANTIIAICSWKVIINRRMKISTQPKRCGLVWMVDHAVVRSFATSFRRRMRWHTTQCHDVTICALVFIRFWPHFGGCIVHTKICSFGGCGSSTHNCCNDLTPFQLCVRCRGHPWDGIWQVLVHIHTYMLENANVHNSHKLMWCSAKGGWRRWDKPDVQLLIQAKSIQLIYKSSAIDKVLAIPMPNHPWMWMWNYLSFGTSYVYLKLSLNRCSRSSR